MFNKLLRVQKGIASVKKDSDNPYFHSSYANIEAVLDVVLPALNDAGLVLNQYITTVGESENIKPALKTVITDTESGESIDSTMLLMTKSNDPQAQGSSVTYARRYAIVSMLGIRQEDDDGNAATPIPADKAMNKTQWAALGKLLDEKGITDRDDKIKLIQTLSDGKALNTSAYQRLEKEIAEAAPDTLQNILMETLSLLGSM